MQTPPIVAQENSYIIVTIIMNVLIFASWIWLSVINWKNGKDYNTWGCLLYMFSYAGLVWRNVVVFNAHRPPLISAVYISYGVYLLQLCASISFIYFSYKHK